MVDATTKLPGTRSLSLVNYNDIHCRKWSLIIEGSDERGSDNRGCTVQGRCGVPSVLLASVCLTSCASSSSIAAMVVVTSGGREDEEEEDCWEAEPPWAMILPPRGISRDIFAVSFSLARSLRRLLHLRSGQDWWALITVWLNLGRSINTRVWHWRWTC